MNEGLITASQAAELLGVSPDTVRRYAEQGLIGCFRLPSGQRRYIRSTVIAYINTRSHT